MIVGQALHHPEAEAKGEQALPFLAQACNPTGWR